MNPLNTIKPFWRIDSPNSGRRRLRRTVVCTTNHNPDNSRGHHGNAHCPHKQSWYCSRDHRRFPLRRSTSRTIVNTGKYAISSDEITWWFLLSGSPSNKGYQFGESPAGLADDIVANEPRPRPLSMVTRTSERRPGSTPWPSATVTKMLAGTPTRAGNTSPNMAAPIVLSDSSDTVPIMAVGGPTGAIVSTYVPGPCEGSLIVYAV